jgi:YtkA-like
VKRVLLLLIGLIACAPPTQNDLDVQLEVSTRRVGLRPVMMTIQYQNKPLENAQVFVRGDMTHAGMVPVRGDAIERGAGRYELEQFNFNMAGDWVLTVTAKQNDKTLLGEARLEIR